MEHACGAVKDRMQLPYEPTQTPLPHRMGGGHENSPDVIPSSDLVYAGIR